MTKGSVLIKKTVFNIYFDGIYNIVEVRFNNTDLVFRCIRVAGDLQQDSDGISTTKFE